MSQQAERTEVSSNHMAFWEALLDVQRKFLVRFPWRRQAKVEVVVALPLKTNRGFFTVHLRWDAGPQFDSFAPDIGVHVVQLLRGYDEYPGTLELVVKDNIVSQWKTSVRNDGDGWICTDLRALIKQGTRETVNPRSIQN